VGYDTDYDAVVVGAGPGGSMTAKTLAEQGASVLLVEKRPEIGMPVRCAEATGILGLNELGIRPDKKFIAKETRGQHIYAPDGSRVVLEDRDDRPTGYVLERRVFDKHLAVLAAKAGANVRARTCATGLLKEGGFVRGVRLKHFGEEYGVTCKCVVGADGIEGQVGRWAGINTRTRPDQMSSNAQFELVGIDIDDPGILEFYLGSVYAPGGYVWVFPKGDDVANVGLGIRNSRGRGTGTGRDQGKTALEYLEKFISSKPGLEKGSRVSVVAGGVPVQGPIDESVGNGILLVGDCARQVDPLTGGGIYNAMRCGVMAGKVIKEAVDKNDTSKEMLVKYDHEWRETVGTALLRSLGVKEALEKLNDDDLNAIAKVMRRLKFGEMDIKDIGKTMTELPPELVGFVQGLLK